MVEAPALDEVEPAACPLSLVERAVGLVTPVAVERPRHMQESALLAQAKKEVVLFPERLPVAAGGAHDVGPHHDAASDAIEEIVLTNPQPP